MNDIEKLIKLLEHAESFSLEAYGKSPNLSECSLNIQYLRACILQAIGNAKALRERLANDKTDKEIMQQALKALEVLTDNYDDNAVGIEIDAIIALRKRLAQPAPLQRLTDVQQEIEAALAPEQKPVDIGTEWTSCVKLPVTVHVRQQRPGETHVSTREGITPVKPDDLIMRGVSGEEYPIGREIFERTYQLGKAQTKPEQRPLINPPACTWTHDNDEGSWDAECGERWSITEGTPEENNFRFCPGCGRQVKTICKIRGEK